MEEFKGISRDFKRTKSPPNTWEFAKNILLKKGYNSVVNEDGHDYKHEVPGEIIGVINTNEEVIYFSVDNNFSYIGYYKTNELVDTYIPVLKSIYLGFKKNRPIEGVYFINFKKEIIIAFCDGIFKDSNTPKLINITNIGVPLTINNEFANPSDINLLFLAPQALEGDIDISYKDNGTLEAEVAYITYCYVLPDNISYTQFFFIHEVAYPMKDCERLNKRDIILNFDNLDSNYEFIKVAITIISETGLKSYLSDNVNIVNHKSEISITGIETYTEIATDTILLGKDSYSRVKTMTTLNDELLIGNLLKTNTLKLQKYINNIRLGLSFDVKPKEYHTHPLLCPDEVYAFYISLQLLDGSYTQEFHIPGEEANPINNELVDLDLASLGINPITVGFTVKNFHILNSGKFKVNTIPCNVNNPSELELDWGFWQNKETYPNNDEYNGSVDYNGTPIVNGRDLRNTNIKYHRIPGLDALVEKFPSLVGKRHYNKLNDINSNGTVETGLLPAFSLSVLNLDDVLPIEIKNQIQGYKLSIAKRVKGEFLVEDICMLSNNNIYNYKDINYKLLRKGSTSSVTLLPYGYYNNSLHSNTLETLKPKINSLILKANFAVNSIRGRDNPPMEDIINSNGGSYSDSSHINQYGSYAFYKIPNIQRFCYISEHPVLNEKTIRYTPPNNTTVGTFVAPEKVEIFCENTLTSVQSYHYFETNETYNIKGWNPLQLPFDSNDLNTNVIYYNSSTNQYELFSRNDLSDENKYFRRAAGGIDINVTLLNIYEDLYKGFNPKNFIVLGKTSLLKTDKTFKNCGDVFTNTIINKLSPTINFRVVGNGLSIIGIYYEQFLVRGTVSITTNNNIYSLFGPVQAYTHYDINSDDDTGSTPDLESIYGANFSLQIFDKPSLRLLNNLFVGIGFNITKPFINYFPYRVHRGLKIGNEAIDTNNIRTFLPNRYKEMLNDRGEIIALRGSNKTLFIQQKYSLFVANIKDRLNSDKDVTYLGESDIFDRIPDEILYSSNKGYIGCTSQFACILIKDGVVVIDQVKGKIFIIGQQAREITNSLVRNYFAENWNTDNYYYYDSFGNLQLIDNPFTQVGHLVGFDDKYNRLLFTKKDYIFKFNNLIGTTYNFDGEYYYNSIDNQKLDFNDEYYFINNSKTFSYSLDDNVWVCEHDYIPNCYFYTNRGLYCSGFINNGNSSVYKFNSKTLKATYFGIKYDSYIDLIFNSRLDLRKLYQNVEWNTEVIGNNNENKYFKTVDYIILYNNNQCSGRIDINDIDINTSRNTEGIWEFNNFRDIVINSSLPIINKEGVVNINNLNNNKSYFEKSNFFGTFIVVRLGMNNNTNDTIYIHYVNVKSRISDR